MTKETPKSETITVVLSRHLKQVTRTPLGHYGGWQPEAPLNHDEAVERSLEMASYFKELGINPKTYYHSWIPRAYQSCAYLRAAMGSTTPMNLHAGLGPDNILEWELPFKDFLSQFGPMEQIPNLSYVEFVQKWPELMRSEAERVWKAVKEIAAPLQPGQTAAAFSHNPLVQLTEWVATGVMPSGPDLTVGQAIAFKFDKDHHFIGCETHRC